MERTQKQSLKVYQAFSKTFGYWHSFNKTKRLANEIAERQLIKTIFILKSHQHIVINVFKDEKSLASFLSFLRTCLGT